MLVGHSKQWEFLKKKFEQNQLSHSYLFAGADGIGKKFFAKEFANFVGCRFPDIMIVEAPKKDQIFGDGGEIKIAKIREVQNFLSYKSYHGGFKIVVVDEAEKMNQESQSCFLKTLEEPKGQTLLFLVSSRPDMLLPTIFSRCQTIKFFKPKDLPDNKEKADREHSILNDLLPMFGASFANKFKYVKSIDFEKQDAVEIVRVLQKHLRKDLIKNRKILELSEEINNKLTFTNANPKLALEILLMEI